MSNLASVLKKKKASEEQAPDAAGSAGIAIEVDGDLPEKSPRIGDVVLLSWGDPQLVGGPMIAVPLIVTLTDPATGRVNGQMITDPTMQGMDPRTGRSIPLPGIAPVANVPYANPPRPLTWRHQDS
jgi:hypothetical protein